MFIFLKGDVHIFKSHCLSSGKMTMGIGGEKNWKKVDLSLKDDIWEQLNKTFSFSTSYKSKVLSKLADDLETFEIMFSPMRQRILIF